MCGGHGYSNSNKASDAEIKKSKEDAAKSKKAANDKKKPVEAR